MVRRGGGEERERIWLDVIRRQRRSDLSIRAFCRREGVSESGFHWWRRELERRRAKRIAPRRPPSATHFVPVTVTPAGSAAAYEVHLPSGVRILVHPSAGERLVDVLAALESDQC